MHLRRAYPVKEGAVNKSDRFHCRVAPAANVNSLLMADAVFMISLAGPSNFADIFSFSNQKSFPFSEPAVIIFPSERR